MTYPSFIRVFDEQDQANVAININTISAIAENTDGEGTVLTFSAGERVLQILVGIPLDDFLRKMSEAYPYPAYTIRIEKAEADIEDKDLSD